MDEMLQQLLDLVAKNPSIGVGVGIGLGLAIGLGVLNERGQPVSNEELLAAYENLKKRIDSVESERLRNEDMDKNAN